MAQTQAFGMKHKARVISRLFMCIERITQNGMANLTHVDAKLVRAPGFGMKPDPAFAVTCLEPSPIGDGLATFGIDFLQRAIGPVDHDRHVDCALCFGQTTPNPCDIGLFHLSFLELKAEVALGMGRQSEDHDARCVPVKSMHQQGVRECPLRPC